MNHGPAPVLVVGAGPTGLTMAAQIHAQQGRVRIIERRREQRRSRAFVVHPRTLESLAPLGVVDELMVRGDPSARATVRAAGLAASVTLARPGIADTAYPFLLAVPQAAVEEVLEDHLLREGITVERGVELLSLRQRPDGVECVLRGTDGQRELARADYVVGCDGADSTVRTCAGIPFPVRDYRPTLVLADLGADGDLEPDAVNGYVGAAGILFLFPSPGGAGWRLLTVGPRPAAGGDPDLPSLQALADRFTGGRLMLRDLAWAERVRLRRGQATRYQVGRVLLAGDAAHLHSPAGAQGMNTGIQDAGNLGWKLALVTTGAATPRLLASYHAERWPVARWIRRLTDLAFLVEAGDAAPVGWLRRYATPLMLPLIDGRAAPAWGFRVLGGLRIRYRRSPVVAPEHLPLGSGVRPGDRLPDGQVTRDGAPVWLHEVLRAPGFHLLLCDLTDEATEHAAVLLAGNRDLPVHVHRLAGRPAPGALVDPQRRLLRRLRGATLVRPDGYVGHRSRDADVDAVIAHLRRTLGASAGVSPVAPSPPAGSGRS